MVRFPRQRISTIAHRRADCPNVAAMATGFLTSKYRDRWAFWEIWALVRKMLMVLRSCP